MAIVAHSRKLAIYICIVFMTYLCHIFNIYTFNNVSLSVCVCVCVYIYVYIYIYIINKIINYLILQNN